MKVSQTDQARFEIEKARLENKAVPFAVATVVRTVDSTSAIPGGKALLDGEGNILEGWVGGGCARGAIGRAAREVIASGQPQLVSVQPQELLDVKGVTPGEERNGVHFARNGCPSNGTVDIFIEAVLPMQELVICGASPVAQALAHLIGRFDYNLTLCAQPGAKVADDLVVQAHEGFNFTAQNTQPAYVVVATQGSGDLPALEAALKSGARYIAFVGSRKKFAVLSAKLLNERGFTQEHVARVRSPAGMNLNAITPDEIALSILAQIVSVRRAPAATADTLDE